MLPHHDRQTPDVVQVAVGDDDEVQVLPAQRGVVGGRAAAHLLRVEPRIHKDVEVAQLDEQRVGANAAIAVQINQLHSLGAFSGPSREYSSTSPDSCAKILSPG